MFVVFLFVVVTLLPAIARIVAFVVVVAGAEVVNVAVPMVDVFNGDFELFFCAASSGELLLFAEFVDDFGLVSGAMFSLFLIYCGKSGRLQRCFKC